MFSRSLLYITLLWCGRQKLTECWGLLLPVFSIPFWSSTGVRQLCSNCDDWWGTLHTRSLWYSRYSSDLYPVTLYLSLSLSFTLPLSPSFLGIYTCVFVMVYTVVTTVCDVWWYRCSSEVVLHRVFFILLRSDMWEVVCKEHSHLLTPWLGYCVTIEVCNLKPPKLLVAP